MLIVIREISKTKFKLYPHFLCVVSSQCVRMVGLSLLVIIIISCGWNQIESGWVISLLNVNFFFSLAYTRYAHMDARQILSLKVKFKLTNWQIFNIQIYRWMCETNNCTFVSFPYLPCNFYFFKTYKFSSFLQKSHALYSFISCMLIVGYT